MKIAIYHNLPPGGAKRALYEYADRLRNNHHIDLYIPSAECEQFLDLRPLMENVFDYSFRYKYTRNAIIRTIQIGDFQKKIAKDIDSKKYDIVFVHHCRMAQTPYILRYLKTPSLYYCQEPCRAFHEYYLWLNMKEKESRWRRRLLSMITINFWGINDRISARRATRIAVNSYYSMESIFRAYGIYPQVCYLGVDTEHFKPLEGIKRENKVISIGALDFHKGHEFIIRGLEKVKKEIRPKLDIIYTSSNANYEKLLIETANNLGVKLTLRNNISEDEMVLAYNQAKITLCFPYLETLGLSPIESMACGTPALGIREGGVREVIEHMQNGILVDRNEDELAYAVEKLLLDVKLWQTFADRGRSSVLEKWTWDKAVMRLEDIMKITVKSSKC